MRASVRFMNLIYCTACGSQISSEALSCPKCGQPNLSKTRTVTQGGTYSTVQGKSRVTAGVLALLLGGIGVHRFYLNQVGLGLVYLLFCWTLIPALIALVEGILYLVQDDQTFARNQNQIR